MIHQYFCRLLQISGAVIITETFPQLHKPVFAHLRQAGDVGKFIGEADKIFLCCLDPGLLQHDFREPDIVRVKMIPPDHIPFVLVIPCQKRQGKVFDIHNTSNRK